MKICITLFALVLSSLLVAIEPYVIVMRHGEAEHNVKDVYNSDPSTRSDLTERGKEQTRATAKELLDKGIVDANVEAVYVSPMPRTRETAQILMQAGLFSQSKIHVDPRLTEVQMGDLEGKPIIHQWDKAYAEKYHTETDEQLQKRITSFYESLFLQKPTGTIIVITHGVPAQKLLGLFEPNPPKLATGAAQVVPLKKSVPAPR